MRIKALALNLDPELQSILYIARVTANVLAITLSKFYDQLTSHCILRITATPEVNRLYDRTGSSAWSILMCLVVFMCTIIDICSCTTHMKTSNKSILQTSRRQTQSMKSGKCCQLIRSPYGEKRETLNIAKW